MLPIQKLEQAVRQLYEAKHPERENWSDWLYQNHVFIVADYAVDLAKRYKADVDLARAAAMLHDIADAVMPRLADAEAHEARCYEIAREYMRAAGFGEADIELVVDDALRYHSCHGDERPHALEGKVLATADSMAHLKTDFYTHAAWGFGVEARPLESFKAWFAKKVDRDFQVKIFFDEVREETRQDYEQVKAVFSR